MSLRHRFWGLVGWLAVCRLGRPAFVRAWATARRSGGGSAVDFVYRIRRADADREAVLAAAAGNIGRLSAAEYRALVAELERRLPEVMRP